MCDRLLVAKAEITASHPDSVLHDEKHKNNNGRDGTLTIGRKTKQELLNSKPTSCRIYLGQVKKDPCHKNTSQLAFEKKMLKGLVISCTKAARVHIYVETVCQPGTRVENPMRNQPVEINNCPVEVAKVQLTPGLGPVQGTVSRQEFLHTVWRCRSSRS